MVSRNLVPGARAASAPIPNAAVLQALEAYKFALKQAVEAARAARAAMGAQVAPSAIDNAERQNADMQRLLKIAHEELNSILLDD